MINMIPRVKDVGILEDYVLIVRFDNDVNKRFDIRSRLCDSRFQPLRDKALFNCVKVDQGGYGISWNDEVDISEYELWNSGELFNTGT